MLSMQNVSMIYRTETVETHALRDFSLEVDEGDFISVSGQCSRTRMEPPICAWCR